MDQIAGIPDCFLYCHTIPIHCRKLKLGDTVKIRLSARVAQGRGCAYLGGGAYYGGGACQGGGAYSFFNKKNASVIKYFNEQ